MNFFNRLIKYYLFHSIEAKNSKENYEEDIYASVQSRNNVLVLFFLTSYTSRT